MALFLSVGWPRSSLSWTLVNIIISGRPTVHIMQHLILMLLALIHKELKQMISLFSKFAPLTRNIKTVPGDSKRPLSQLKRPLVPSLSQIL
ncbi:hypothetical protein BD769DRAFT_1469887 [Suillus cothurnatus]|nr:hypothetical protein BD769DRAFT_1469887 [Suillus cothurnatus]